MPSFRVDRRGTSQICPNCRAEVRKDLSNRYYVCQECGYGVNYPVDRDIASGQELCNRGEETYRGTREKQEIGSQIVLSGNFVVDKWRNSAQRILATDALHPPLKGVRAVARCRLATTGKARLCALSGEQDPLAIMEASMQNRRFGV